MWRRQDPERLLSPQLDMVRELLEEVTDIAPDQGTLAGSCWVQACRGESTHWSRSA